ncbi:MAG: N-acetylglucosamine-6-phosphate deacetylase [Chloroflexi bacterium]|nr:N-acetylglucosamine-6-phosphate deacetylase [Chloroflexota bacterium]
MSGRQEIRGRLVLDDRVVIGRLVVEDVRIASIDLDDDSATAAAQALTDAAVDLPYIAPGFVDVHVHGWGGHDAMGSAADLDGMARALLRHGVTSFLPTGWTSPMPELQAFADRVRAWIPNAPADGADPLGFNLEGPFLSAAKKGAHNPSLLRNPAEVPWSEIEPLVEGLTLMTVAPEIPGGIELIRRLRSLGVRISIGHSGADLTGALAGYDAGGTTTTHLFNGMTGVDHRAPGVAVAALTRDEAYVELIADGHHVHPAVWTIIERSKPADRLMLISDALSMAGMGDGRVTIGGQDIDIRDGRCTLADAPDTLAGSVIALDTAVRNLVGNGASLPAASAAAGRNPLAMLGIEDRGTLAIGQRADIVELDHGLAVRRVMRGGIWI